MLHFIRQWRRRTEDDTVATQEARQQRQFEAWDQTREHAAESTSLADHLLESDGDARRRALHEDHASYRRVARPR